MLLCTFLTTLPALRICRLRAPLVVFALVAGIMRGVYPTLEILSVV